MPDPEPLQFGDELTLVHVSGTTRVVSFAGVYGAKFTAAYVRWGEMAGDYQVKLDTGQLLPKKASLWRVCDTDLRRLRATLQNEQRLLRHRLRDGRGRQQ